MEAFGNKLKSARQAKNLTIEDVAKHTKLRQHYIVDMEEGRFSELPPVYGKAFVRTYASFLDIPAEEYNNLIENLNKVDITYQETVKPAPIPATEKGRRNKKMSNYKILFKNAYKNRLSSVNMTHVIIYTIVGAALLLVLYYTFVADGLQDNTKDQAMISSDSSLMKPTNTGLFSYFEATGDSISLHAVAYDTAWIKIDIDGERQEELMMVPKMERTWFAGNYFIVNEGNVGAIRYKRNGELLPPFGNKGTVVKNVKVTYNEIIPETVKRDTIRSRTVRPIKPKPAAPAVGNNPQQQNSL